MGWIARIIACLATVRAVECAMAGRAFDNERFLVAHGGHHRMDGRLMELGSVANRRPQITMMVRESRQ